MNVGQLKQILDEYGDHVDVIVAIEHGVDEHEVEDFEVGFRSGHVEIVATLP